MVSAAERLASNFDLSVIGKATELKRRLWFVMGALIVVRIGAYIPLPGINLQTITDNFKLHAGGVFGVVLKLARPFLLTPEKGADTLVWLATSPEVAGVSGEYFALRKPANRSAEASDDGLAAKLWAASEAIWAEH